MNSLSLVFTLEILEALKLLANEILVTGDEMTVVLSTVACDLNNSSSEISSEFLPSIVSELIVVTVSSMDTFLTLPLDSLSTSIDETSEETEVTGIEASSRGAFSYTETLASSSLTRSPATVVVSLEGK